jgi:hemerythrin
MALLEWSDKYNVGVRTWDSQHQGLVAILNDLHSAILAGQVQAETGPLLQKLLDYTQNHFATEERMMTDAGHPGLAHHRELHRELTARVVEFIGRYKDGDAGMYLPLLKFLRDWLADHILREDCACGNWMVAHGIH